MKDIPKAVTRKLATAFTASVTMRMGMGMGMTMMMMVLMHRRLNDNGCRWKKDRSMAMVVLVCG
ncbi:hypothetical protein DIZ47_07335 [Legionella taurinensis]|uniref:Uncharacterized protein n=1 Tax=Legionella taurinensis TaxID=70611 RepID=A0ABX5JNP2_9GAMM|nr:hypothetical protein DB744_04995 [Legionella taurinensis]PUT47351.1 hypothetical protein DB745_08410 [Legionella taurinensis]TID37159.1 hypothetical protein DIZ42_04995 [Legionella taurinensis]TID37471.1 hypothetical protein DIZ67_04980 [Legionella taurinensis]TID43627.1 hypothetical protein DIZ39_08410 [Legionella taurinensis]